MSSPKPHSDAEAINRGLNPLTKTALLFSTVLGIIVLSMVVMISNHDELENRVKFSLTDHNGNAVNEKDFAGRHQMVFFGFTSCQMICPTHMHKLTQILDALEEDGDAHKINPLFISVDPERDSPEKINDYLTHFHDRIIGLTGSRHELKTAADTFRTLLASAPTQAEPGYQISHSSIVYVVDPFSRVVDYLSFDNDTDIIVEKLQTYL